METLYDLLGALPNDDADSLRAAFRRAVKRSHPDVNPGDPDAGLKFRQIVRANEILGDVEQRAAYDHLLETTRLEQEHAETRAFAAKIHKLASGVMALAAVSAGALGGYALFLQLSANTSATITAEAVPELGAVVVSRAAGNEPSSSSATPVSPAAGADVTTSMMMPAAESVPPNTTETVRGRVAPQFDRNQKQAPKFLSTYIDHSIILYHLRRLARSFAELAPAKRAQRASRPTASLSRPSQIIAR